MGEITMKWFAGEFTLFNKTVAIITLLILISGFGFFLNAQISKSIKQDTSKYEIPESKVVINPEQIYLMNKEILDLATKRLDNTITLFGVLMSVIVLVFSGALVFLQIVQNKQAEKNLELKFNALKEKNDLGNFKQSIESKLKSELSEIDKRVEGQVQLLFEKFAEKYKNQLYADVIQFTNDALLLSSESRDILNSRNRRAIGEIKLSLKEKLDTEKLGDALKSYAIDWLTIQRIFSKEKVQLLSGLDDFITTNQIPELKNYFINTLLKEYRGDADVVPRIERALKALVKDS